MNLREVSSKRAHIIKIRPAKHTDVYEDVLFPVVFPVKSVSKKGRVICRTDKGPRVTFN